MVSGIRSANELPSVTVAVTPKIATIPRYGTQIYDTHGLTPKNSTDGNLSTKNPERYLAIQGITVHVSLLQPIGNPQSYQKRPRSPDHSIAHAQPSPIRTIPSAMELLIMQRTILLPIGSNLHCLTGK